MDAKLSLWPAWKSYGFLSQGVEKEYIGNEWVKYVQFKSCALVDDKSN